MITKEEKEKLLLFGSESKIRRSINNNNNIITDNPVLPLQGHPSFTVAPSPSLTINTVFSFSFSFFLSFILQTQFIFSNLLPCRIISTFILLPQNEIEWEAFGSPGHKETLLLHLKHQLKTLRELIF